MNTLKTISTIIKAATIATVAFCLGSILYAMPAARSLWPGVRPGIRRLTIKQAVGELLISGEHGWDLVEAARALVSERMQYSRRNSLDSPSRAFERGYGYCLQMSFALAALLKGLGFEAEVVQSFRNEMNDGQVTAHAWVRVFHGGQIKDIDALHYDPLTRRITFRPLSRVTGIGPVFYLVTVLGGNAINARRYYRTGKDY